MKLKALLSGTSLLLLLASCQSGKNLNSSIITLRHPGTEARRDVLIHLPATDLPKLELSKVAFYEGNEPVPFQAADRDGDGRIDAFALLVDFAGKEIKTIAVRETNTPPSFPKRTQAELSHKVGGRWEGRKYVGGSFQNVDKLRVPAEHTDHSFFIRYEGPGWESDKVGYRFYLDWRDASDVFGKTTPEMVLQQVGQDGFDSYHEQAAWGMDVLKVGESLGIGTLAKWHMGKAERVAKTDSVYCEIVENGPVESRIRTKYYGWAIAGKKTDLSSELSIAAGSRLSRHEVQLSASLDSMCTGIVKLDNSTLLKSTTGQWGYLATWGKQSLNNDLLGLAVIFRTADLLQLTADKHSHVAVLKPSGNRLSYYFLAAWEKEPEGIRSQEAFEAYLNTVVRELGEPVEVKLNRRLNR